MWKHIHFPNITALIAAMKGLQSGCRTDNNSSSYFSNSLYYLVTSGILKKYLKIKECLYLVLLIKLSIDYAMCNKEFEIGSKMTSMYSWKFSLFEIIKNLLIECKIKHRNSNITKMIYLEDVLMFARLSGNLHKMLEIRPIS